MDERKSAMVAGVRGWAGAWLRRVAAAARQLGISQRVEGGGAAVVLHRAAVGVRGGAE